MTESRLTHLSFALLGNRLKKKLQRTPTRLQKIIFFRHSREPFTRTCPITCAKLTDRLTLW